MEKYDARLRERIHHILREAVQILEMESHESQPTGELHLRKRFDGYVLRQVDRRRKNMTGKVPCYIFLDDMLGYIQQEIFVSTSVF